MKYLNAVLTVIAVCLVLITCAVTGILPAAHANDQHSRFATVPVNTDGSINVKIVAGEPMDVNIQEISGSSFHHAKIPVSINSPLDVNIEKIKGSSFFLPLEVKVKSN